MMTRTMKKIQTIKVMAFVTFLSLSYSCTDDFESLNTNPNGPAVLNDIGPLLTHAQANILAPSRFVTWRENLIFASRFAEHWSFGFSGSWFPDGSGFKDRQDWHDGVWDDSFGLKNAVSNNNIGDLAEIMRLTEPGGQFESDPDHGVAIILRVLLLQKVADNFGAIPYTDAGTGSIAPRFQQVEEVYPLMIADLDRAMTLIGSATDSGLGAADMVYGGDYQKWRRLANTEKLRIAIRGRSGSGNNFSAQAITEAIANPLLQNNGDNVVFNRDASLIPLRQGLANVWSGFGDILGPKWIMSQRLVERMDGTILGTADPRLPFFAAPAINDGVFRGQEVGLSAVTTSTVDIDDYSYPNAAIYDADNQFPSYFFNYAEAEFLQAEAALFSLGGSGADAHFKAGIRASMEQWGVAEADIVTFLASPAATLAGTQEQQFEQIATQRWISVYTNGPEAWAIVRRTGYPVIEDKSDVRFGDTSGWADNVLPQRLNYSVTSYTLNEANVLEAVAGQGPDRMTTKLWWAK